MSAHVLVAAFLWLLVAVAVGVNAIDHDRSPFFWGVLTVLTGLIGVIVYLVVIGNELDDPDRTEGVVVCPNCSTRHPDSPAYCSDCGEPLETEPKTSTASMIRSGPDAYCGNCQTRVEFGTDECPRCGSVF